MAIVPIAASLRGTRPIPAQIERLHSRHGRGGNDSAECDTGNVDPVAGLPNPRPDGPYDHRGSDGHSVALAGCDTGFAGRDASVDVGGGELVIEVTVKSMKTRPKTDDQLGFWG